MSLWGLLINKLRAEFYTLNRVALIFFDAIFPFRQRKKKKTNWKETSKGKRNKKKIRA